MDFSALENSGKKYWKVAEVAQMFQVPEYTIRYWEKEFDYIQPKKGGRDIRYYSLNDIKKMHTVHFLLKERGLTIAGAKESLKRNKDGVDKTADAVARLEEVKKKLQSLHKALDSITYD